MKVKLQYDVELHPGCCEKSSFDELSPSFCKVRITDCDLNSQNTKFYHVNLHRTPVKYLNVTFNCAY